MKKYPKSLADLDALRDCIAHLYNQYEQMLEQMDRYSALLLESPEDEWYTSEFAEAEAKAAAFVRLAEKLSK